MVHNFEKTFFRKDALIATKLLALAAGFLCLATVLCRAQAPDQKLSKEALSDFAMHEAGDTGRGWLLFNDEGRTACTKCHTTDGKGGKAGPDLAAVGDKFEKPELVRSVLEPSSTIAVGYCTTIVDTKDGESHQGVLKQATESWIELMDGNGHTERIATSDIKDQRISNVSLMPEGWEQNLKPAEFADLIAYLRSLHQPLEALGKTRGMPEVIPQATRQIQFRPLFGAGIKFDHPVWFTEMPGATNRFMVLEGAGKGWLIEQGKTGEQRSLLFDISSEVHFNGGSGLLGMAFHPKFADNHKYYITYQTSKNGHIRTKLVERKFATDLKTDDSASVRMVWEIEATTQDHTGGAILFGRDGYLYLGMGDTGPQRDPQGHGQDLNLLLGKVLRIDVDHADGPNGYRVPKDNPFVGKPNVRPEIWAYGFREPWRASFDPITGDLWVGDVGQDRVEEVTLVRAGENHGWNVFEGHASFSDKYRREGEKYIPPVFSYPHRTGVSITAGYVYRGDQAPKLAGQFICGDFETRRIWALTHTNRLLSSIVEIGRAPDRLVSFAQNSAGELYTVGYDNGLIQKMDLASVDLTPRVSHVLAATSEESPVLWRYCLEAPANGWFGSEFDDSSWKISPGGFGTRETPGAIVRTEWRSQDIWLRRAFTVPAEAIKSKCALALRIHHDEDVEIYLNGVEIARAPRWTSNYIELPLPPEVARNLSAGKNVLAIHCHQNNGGQYIDAGLIQYDNPDS